LTELRVFAALSGLLNTARLLIFGGTVTLFLIFGMSSYSYATEEPGSEQVIVSPAQQAVNDALVAAATEVQQAIAATDSATVIVASAQTELTQATAAVSDIPPATVVAEDKVNVVQLAIDTINEIDISVTSVTQSSDIVLEAKDSVTNAIDSITDLTTEISQAEAAVSEVTAAKTTASTAQATAQTELTQANIAIDAAQTAVNNLQATIGASTNVLAGVDDAGVLMNLPFELLMGGTLYNNVYVGSNATVTFGVNEGSNYWSTPNAPSISIAGWDWTTWSTGTGITYATTGTSLDIAWDLRPFPQQDASTQMAQIRFNADVNPVNGAWIADVTATGPIPDQARFNYRETTNGTINNITDTNLGSGFAGQLSQGPEFTPYVDPNTSTIQEAVDAANATIAQLNSSLSPVVAQNTSNTSAINAINTTSLTNTINSAASTNANLQSVLILKANELLTAITTNIPVSAPVVEDVITDYYTETPSGPIEEPQLPVEPEVPPVEPEGPLEEVEQPVEETPQPESEEPGPESQLEEPSSEPTTPEEIVEAMEDVLIDGNLTAVEADAVIESLMADGEVTEAEATALIETLSDGPMTNAEEDLILDALSADGEVTQEEVNNLSETLSEDGTFTADERELVAEALIESVEPGESLTKEAIQEAGIEYKDLPSETPVEVRQDERGNEVIITADVAAALVLLENPSELIGAIFSDPGEAIQAIGSIGADMSTEEREESQEMVVAAIIASGAALNAVGAATAAVGGSTSSSGGSSGGGGASGDLKGTRRRKP